MRIKLSTFYVFSLVGVTVVAYLTFTTSTEPHYILGIQAYKFNVGVILMLMSALMYLLAQTSFNLINKNIYLQKMFIASASHELRTPLSIMKANSEVALLNREELSTEEVFEVLEDNIEEINRMSDIISMLLYMDKMQKNPGNIQQYAKLDLAVIINTILQEIEDSTAKEGIGLHKDITSEVNIWGNQVSLRVMALNLINNSVHYTPAGGDIFVSLKYKDDYKNVEFKILDTGIGISKKDLPNIFHPFYRTRTAKDKEQTGHFGLGLSLVQKVVEEHGGSVNISSPNEKGVQVVVKIPVALEDHLSEFYRQKATEFQSKNTEIA